MGDISPHFSRSEFRDRSDGTLIGPDTKLLQVLERLRATDGRPIRIISGTRSRAHNASVGGAKDSQHLYGRAADIESGRFSVAQALHAGATGVGHDRCGWVVHLDTRRGATAVFLDV